MKNIEKTNNANVNAKSINKKQNLKAKKHKEKLGFSVPVGYFSASKNEILQQTVKKHQPKVINIWAKKQWVWYVAASMALLFVVTTFKPTIFPQIQELPAIVSDTVDQLKTKGLTYKGENIAENDILIKSLFVEDSEIDAFLTDYVIEELVYDDLVSN